MKILQYNFAQPGGYETGAGGVGIYLASLVEELSARGHEVFCLSSGNAYDGDLKTVRLTRWEMAHHVALEVVNSPVIGPLYKSFFSLKAYLESTELDHVPLLIKKRTGELDVIHIHNNEGLTHRFFYKLRKSFPQTLIVMSAHNYTLVCPQVNLWQNNTRTCLDYKDGRACVSCIGFEDAEHHKKIKSYERYLYEASLKRFHFLKPKFQHPPSEVDHWRRSEWQRREMLPLGLSATYRSYRSENASMILDVCDLVLAVSERTKQVLVDHGIPSQALRVSYIGSRHVDAFNKRRSADYESTLNLAYVGYARRDKGFDFFLEAMEQTSDALAAKITLHIVTSVEHGGLIQRVGALAQRFADIRLINGYDASDLSQILSRVDLGVVPPLWEDNLPQVAIEYVAHGVPILVSDLGGASEIARNRNFTFKAGSHESLVSKLRAIVDREIRLSTFWQNEPNIRSSSRHVDDLLGIYSQRRTATAGR